MNNLKKWNCIVAVALVSAYLVLISAAVQAGNPSTKVAVVNGVVISQDDFTRELTRAKQQLARMRRTPDDRQMVELKEKVLESLVSRELLYQESQKRGIKVGKASVDQQINTMKKRFPDEEAYRKTLRRMELSDSDLKNQIGKGLAIQQLIEKQFADRTSIPKAEVKAFYDANPNSFRQPEQVRASHILIRVDPQADKSKKSKARQEMSKISDRIRAGEDFAALAKEFSQDSSSSKGGDLGSFRRGQMVKPFEDAAFSLKPGEVSQVVETRFGFHIIKVTEKKPETTLAFKDVQEKLYRYLKQQKVKQQVNVYIVKLKENAKVDRFPEGMP
ncbi:peptidylprolyl isomerase [Thermodesulfobacteriota bacterium]